MKLDVEQPGGLRRRAAAAFLQEITETTENEITPPFSSVSSC